MKQLILCIIAEMQTYNNIRQIFPSFRLSTILKSIESTTGTQLPEPAEDIYRKINGNIFMLSNTDGRYTLSTVIDIQSPYLVKSYDSMIDVPCINQKVKYIIYDLHSEVYDALRHIYLRENNTSFAFFNSYTSEYWHTYDNLMEEQYNEEVHDRIMQLKPDFSLDLLLRKIQLIYSYAQTPLSFQLPLAINKVQFNGKEILFETVEGNVVYPCNIKAYDVVISQLILQSTSTVPFINGLTTYHSTYTIATQ